MTTTSATSSVTSLLNSSSGSGSKGTGNSILSAAGVGSGLDVTSIVTALVNAKQAAPQAQITSKTNQTNSLLTGLSTLKSALTSLQTAATALSDASTFNSYAGTLADASIGSVSTRSNALPGSYALDVTQLATAQKRSSAAYASGTAIGGGTLNISIGTASVSVDVSATASLTDIATAINGASGNPGVTATVVNGASGSQLLLSSNKTGVANGFTISAASGSSAGLGSLATSLNTAGSNEAKDAQLTLDGISISSASNAVSGAIDGVTVNLTTTGTTQLVVKQDTSVAQAAVAGFVTAYNSYVSAVGSLASYDSTTRTSGVLLGDSTLNSVQRQISSVLSSAVPGNSIGSLVSLGMTRAADGTISLDSTKLTSALGANPAAVQDLFGGSKGYATRLNAAIDGFTSSSGIIATRQKSLTASLSKLSDQQTALNSRMSVYQQQLQAEYTNLDTLMSSLNTTSSFLSTTLAQLTNPSKN